MYALTVNIPGCLPDTTDLETYDNPLDARSAFAGALDALCEEGYAVLWRQGDYARLERFVGEDGLAWSELEVELAYLPVVA